MTDRLTPDDLAFVQRIRRDGKRHQDGCLDVFGAHLRDEPFNDEELFHNLSALVMQEDAARRAVLRGAG